MKAAVLTQVQKPLELKTLADPEPGAGQVRLRIHASGLCGTDMHVWHGHFPLKLPAVIGHEPVGVIDKLGAGGATWSRSSTSPQRAR